MSGLVSKTLRPRLWFPLSVKRAVAHFKIYKRWCPSHVWGSPLPYAAKGFIKWKWERKARKNSSIRYRSSQRRALENMLPRFRHSAHRPDGPFEHLNCRLYGHPNGSEFSGRTSVYHLPCNISLMLGASAPWPLNRPHACCSGCETLM